MQSSCLQDHIRPFGQTCFGCGQENSHGLGIRSYADGEGYVCRWQPQPWHVAGPGFVNGGVIATLLDCHMGIAATDHGHRTAGQALGSEPLRVWVTASLHVDYLRPTPADAELELRARVVRQEGRRITVTGTLHARGQETAKAEAVFVEARNSAAL